MHKTPIHRKNKPVYLNDKNKNVEILRFTKIKDFHNLLTRQKNFFLGFIIASMNNACKEKIYESKKIFTSFYNNMHGTLTIVCTSLIL
jgi:hypothetical protein